MAITRKPPTSVEEFVSAAPDGGRKGVIKGKKEQITLTITPELLAKVDAVAKKFGQSRAAIINLAIYRLVEQES